MSAQTSVMGGIRGHLGLSKLQILGVDSVIVWKYVGMLLWPSHLSVLYDQPTEGILFSVIVSSIAWAAVGFVCWKTWRHAPLISLAVVVWFLLLFPVLNFFPITTLMNDRYLYLPCVCAFALTAGLIAKVGRAMVGEHSLARQRRWFVLSATSGLMVCLALVGYASATVSHLPVWRESLTLWGHADTRVPQLPVVQIQWAGALHDADRTADALSVLKRTLQTGQPDAADRERIERKITAWTNESDH